MGADVTLLDTDLDKLRMSFWRYDNRVAQIASSAMSVKEQVLGADLVIGTVLIPGARPPVRHRRDGRADEARLGARRRRDRPGRLLRALAATTHADPTYEVHDSIYYCVANMPGAVPHTSTWALTNATLSYATELAENGWKDAMRAEPPSRGA